VKKYVSCDAKKIMARLECQLTCVRHDAAVTLAPAYKHPFQMVVETYGINKIFKSNDS
jgi:hypothetical protein